MKTRVKRISAFTAALLLGGTLSLSSVVAADGMPGFRGGFDRDGSRFSNFDQGRDFDRFNRFNNRMISNMNDVRITNTNDQFARSGDAAVFGNRFGGAAITGDAINNNSAAFDVDVSNF